MIRYLTSGESHGPGLVAVAEGFPAGIELTRKDLESELARRRLGFGRGPRMALEADRVTLLGGVRHGKTLGSPVSMLIENSEFEEKWSEEMSPDPGEPKSKLTQPRPGHADMTGMIKYDFDDARNVLERASARETAARVAVGTLAKAFLSAVGIEIISHVLEIGGVRARPADPPGPGDLSEIDSRPTRCIDPDAAAEMEKVIAAARSDGDTVGGMFEVVAFGVPPGIGSYVHWDRKLDALLAGALMSINAIKAIEVGDGLAQAASLGSEAHDEILPGEGGETGSLGPVRASNRAGGIEGGMSTGEPIRVRAAMKPLASLSRPLRTVDISTGEAAEAFKQRTDTCAVPAAGVVGESMVAIVIASEMLRKFGGDSLGETKRNLASFESWLGRDRR